ncbi:MAG: PSD1 and planctomycete cytochrome C domain-containing protein [Verrucomicrobiales bacterium]
MKIIAAITVLTTSSAAPGAAVDFIHDVQPLLTAHCIKCHGGVRAKAGLSFVRKDSAFAPAKSGLHPIVSGKPEASELLARITSHDEDERMPPEEPLTAQQIKTLRTWIAEGARWPGHWAFLPPGKTDGETIDSLVESSLSKAGLSASPQAPRHTLIRRLYLDLLGLPPSPAAVTAFAADTLPGAYQRLVDRTLSLPGFGERWARHWLDAARYADSDGYEKDNARPDAWRWRKWVIDAINDDMPFDQFTIEQLAGDLLANATPSQKLATAFHRQTLFNREGGVDPEEDRTKRTIDRTATTASTWLGLSIECAQCHDHPYDPVSQREFYRFYAFFNNAGEADAQVPRGNPPELEELKTKMTAARTARQPAFKRWLNTAQEKVKHAGPLGFKQLGSSNISSTTGTRFIRQEDGSYLAGGGRPLATELYRVTAKNGGAAITGLKLEVLPHKSLAENGPGRTGNGNFVLSELRVLAANKLIPVQSAKADFNQTGWEADKAIDGDRATGWAIAPQTGKAHNALITFAEPLDAASLTIELDQNYAQSAGKEGHQIGRFRILLMTGGAPYPDLPGDQQNALAADKMTAQERGKLADYYFANIDPQTRPIAAAVSKMQPKNMMKARVMRAQNRQTFVFHRGDFLQPEKEAGEVIPNTPEILPAMTEPENGIPDRLDLARWIVAPGNPLAARVAANDIWSRLFGKGLVENKADFGTRSAPPLQLKLLDHLAGELLKAGWSRKKLIRSILLSATYRQSARHRQKATIIDPGNALLHRQDRFRVEGEIMRDIFLSASGLLRHQVGSPSVFPPIPPDVAAQSYAGSFKWKTSTGADRYRRGMYTFFKRTAADPNLIAFDCPDANVSVARRNRSNTPIMALTTLGNEVFHEAAQAMAKKILGNSSLPDEAARIDHCFLLCTARRASPEERTAVAALLEKSRAYYAANPSEAGIIAGKHRQAQLPAPENAAWIATTRIILNLDETITRE